MFDKPHGVKFWSSYLIGKIKISQKVKSCTNHSKKEFLERGKFFFLGGFANSEMEGV